MEIRYCCSEAESTAFLRYGKRVTRVKHQNYWIDHVGYCEGTGTISVPDNKIVPAKNAKRFFCTVGGELRKHYMCPYHASEHKVGFYKTKGEALAALATLILTRGYDE